MIAEPKLTQNSLCLNSGVLNPSMIFQSSISHSSRGILDTGASFGLVNPAFSSRRKAISVHKTHLASFGTLATGSNTCHTQQPNHLSGSSIANPNMNRLFSETSKANALINSSINPVYQTTTNLNHHLGPKLGSLHKQLQLRIKLKPAKEAISAQQRVARNSSQGMNVLSNSAAGVRNSSPGIQPQQQKSPHKYVPNSSQRLPLNLASAFLTAGGNFKPFARNSFQALGDSTSKGMHQLLTNRTGKNQGRTPEQQGLQIERISQMLLNFKVNDLQKRQSVSRSAHPAEVHIPKYPKSGENPGLSDLMLSLSPGVVSKGRSGLHKKLLSSDLRENSSSLIYYPNKSRAGASRPRNHLSFDVRSTQSGGSPPPPTSHRPRPSSSMVQANDRPRKVSRQPKRHRSADEIRQKPTPTFNEPSTHQCGKHKKSQFPSRLEFSVRSRKGTSVATPDKPNQDSFLALKNWNGMDQVHLFGVYDGHGQMGHLVSSYLASNLPSAIKDEITALKPAAGDTRAVQSSTSTSAKQTVDKSEEQLAVTAQVLHGAYRRIFEQLVHGNIDVAYSGSTAVTCVVQGRTVLTANSGDSRAIVGYTDDTGAIRAQNLSTDHKPEIEKEAQRILSSGGRIEPFRQSNGKHFGPNRVWLATEDVPGLAMSRAMGDLVACSVGVTWRPEISDYQLNSEDKFILVGSDGLWEHLPNEQIAETVFRYYRKHDLEGACDQLLSMAIRSWKDTQHSDIDDITFLLIFLA